MALSLEAWGDAACVSLTMLQQLPESNKPHASEAASPYLYLWTTQHLEGNEFHMFTTHCIK